MKIFEVAALYAPKSKKNDADEAPKIVVPITAIVAADLATAQMRVARMIPEEYVDKLDQVQVAVRPF